MEFLIKTPQLIGIVLGCFVFFLTIAFVLYFTYLAVAEMKLNASLAPSRQQGNNLFFAPLDVPELYESLLDARLELAKSVPLRPPVLVDETIELRLYNSLDTIDLKKACDGSASYHESDYTPTRIWCGLDVQRAVVMELDVTSSSTDNCFDLMYNSPSEAVHMVIVDKELQRAVGMLTLVDNEPWNLSIRIENIWITPAFQGTKRAHRAMLLVVSHLFSVGYRRVSSTLNERHVIGRRFLERCGMRCEATLRKHKISNNRNVDSALYVVLNSEWGNGETGSQARLRKYLGLPKLRS